MNAKQAKRAAIAHLGASRSSRGYTYLESGATWLVSAKDVTKLGYMLASEDNSIAYSLWCTVSFAKLVRA